MYDCLFQAYRLDSYGRYGGSAAPLVFNRSSHLGIRKGWSGQDNTPEWRTHQVYVLDVRRHWKGTCIFQEYALRPAAKILS